MDKGCDNCKHSGRPSYEYPCTVCETAYGSAPSKWESMVSTTADMVEVVRCKDCASGKGAKHKVCPLYRDGLMKDEDFCSAGERKQEV